MDNDTVVRLGDAVVRLLSDSDFNELTQRFEAQTLEALLSTKRPDKEQREELFATVQSVRDFMMFMVDIAKKKSQLEDPVIEDTTDDPRVHDIYDEE